LEESWPSKKTLVLVYSLTLYFVFNHRGLAATYHSKTHKTRFGPKFFRLVQVCFEAEFLDQNWLMVWAWFKAQFIGQNWR
jgi:hypothetical protein